MLAIEDFSSKVVNATQPLVERNLEDILCPVDIYNPQSSLEVHQNTYQKALTLIYGSHDESFRVHF